MGAIVWREPARVKNCSEEEMGGNGSRPSPGGRESQGCSLDPADKSLEIGALGKDKEGGVVGGLAEAFENLRNAVSIEGGVGNDLLEEVGLHEARAGEGEENSAGAQEFEGEDVDILVAARGAFELGAAFGEFGRIEDDDVELARLVAEAAEDLEYVAGGVGPGLRLEA